MLPPPTTMAIWTPPAVAFIISRASHWQNSGSIPYSRLPKNISPESFRRIRLYGALSIKAYFNSLGSLLSRLIGFVTVAVPQDCCGYTRYSGGNCTHYDTTDNSVVHFGQDPRFADFQCPLNILFCYQINDVFPSN